MGLLNKLFGKKSQNSNTTTPPAKTDPGNDPNMIRVFDEYGRELFITKQQWRDNVLMGTLEKERDHPDQLYSLIIGAIQDGFAADVVSYAEHLKKIDPIPSRGATILGIVYMEVNRLDDAQRVFEEYISQYGEEGVVLTNLAKVYSSRGDNVRAESILWHALELDPNQENGLGWYAVIHKERDGEAAALEAWRRVAKLPRSWRARLWLAREALQNKDLTTAETLYNEALTLADHPVPTDLLMQMSGDLGNSGYIAEAARLTEPHFDPVFHGLQVGNNIIKGNLDLGRIEPARQVLNQLHHQQRPDWKPTLNYWDSELGKVVTALKAKESTSDRPAISMVTIQGPLWTRDGSPFISLLPVKRSDATRFAVFGSTVLLEHMPDLPALQPTNVPGRVSRAVPLALAESIHLNTDAMGLALIPWATGKGFALFGKAYDDQSLCALAGKGENLPDYFVGFVIDARQETNWRLNLRLLRRADAKLLAETTVEGAVNNLAPAIEQLRDVLTKWLVAYAGVAVVPAAAWYPPIPQAELSDYLTRLEQQLAVLCRHFMPDNDGAIFGEREILDGTLQLCLRQPANPAVRMLYAQTLRQMKKVRPEILFEYKDKTEKLQKNYPLSKEIELLLQKAYLEAFSV